MPPVRVKAYVKWGRKNDAADAAAICEAVRRPSMRFVPVKTVEQQAVMMLHQARQLLVEQRTRLGNAIRGHLSELGIVAAKGAAGLVYHHPLYITGFSKIIVHVGNSAASYFSGFYPHTSKMLKLQMDDLPVLPSHGVPTNKDDQGYVPARDGDIEYEIPASIRERGYLRKLEVVFGRSHINGLRFACRIA